MGDAIEFSGVGDLLGRGMLTATSHLVRAERLLHMEHPFEHAVAEHGTVVLRVCRAVLGPVEADDAWSETFLAALRAWPGLPADTNVRAWLVTVAHRKAIDVHRARGRQAVPVGSIPDQPGRADDQPDASLPDDRLWAALADLPPKQRQCVAYHHVAGVPHAEVAAIVGGTASASRRAAADGIATLRRTYLAQRVSTHV